MRLVLDITRTRDGRYEGCLTVAETGGQHEFAGILELLAILEEQLGPEDVPQAVLQCVSKEAAHGTIRGGIIGAHPAGPVLHHSE